MNHCKKCDICGKESEELFGTIQETTFRCKKCQEEVEPEKKDVWKLENWEKKCPKCRRTLPDSFIKKLRTHFIPRADVVEKVEKYRSLAQYGNNDKKVESYEMAFDDLLNLLTQ